MSQVDTLRSDIARLTKKDAQLKKDLAKHRDTEQKATAAASKKRRDAARTSNDGARRTAEQAAEREEKKAAQASKSIAEVAKKIGDNVDAIAKKERSLTSALAQEQRNQDRAADQRRIKEKNHARDVARLSGGSSGLSRTLEVRYVEVQPPKPEMLRVLYVTANPEATETVTTKPDGTVVEEGTWLRVDREVRQVKQRLKAAKYRDLIELEHIPAATTFDIVDGLNEHRPHVVHISSHGDSLGLLMEDEDGSEAGEDLDFTMLAKLLGASDTPPDLLVLNACESLDGADELLKTVPIVIAMSDSIDDPAAVVFAAHFYSAIASAQSVGTALQQAKNAMEILALGDADLPEARTREDIDLQARLLVQPAL